MAHVPVSQKSRDAFGRMLDGPAKFRELAERWNQHILDVQELIQDDDALRVRLRDDQEYRTTYDRVMAAESVAKKMPAIREHLAAWHAIRLRLLPVPGRDEGA